MYAIIVNASKKKIKSEANMLIVLPSQRTIEYYARNEAHVETIETTTLISLMRCVILNLKNVINFNLAF